ncbi:MAG: effector-binding domain-containing protein [Oleiphilaceae bacterium]|jgi:effector-binding domain-containing protein
MSIEQKEISARIFLSAKKTLTIPEIPVFADEVVEKIFKEAEELQLVINGPCEFIYFGCTGNIEEPFDLRIAIPVEQKKTNPELFEYYESPAFVCVYQDYQGSMKNIGDGWDALCAETEKAGFRFSDGGHIREVYKKWNGFDDFQNITELQIEIK